MNNITNVKIEGDKMSFYILSNISIVNTNDLVIYVDECSNISKIYCSDQDNHNYVLDYLNSEFSLKEIVREGEEPDVTLQYSYEITVTSDIIKEFDRNMKYIKAFVTTEEYANDYADGIFYDPIVLYNAEIKALRNFCSTCLDDKQMQLLVLVVLKRQLLEQAIETGHNKDALQYYLDLTRMLNVSINNNQIEKQQCTNGMCSIG